MCGKTSCTQPGKWSQLVIFIKCFQVRDYEELPKNEISYFNFRQIAVDRATFLQDKFEIILEETFRNIEYNRKVEFEDVQRFVLNLLVPSTQSQSEDLVINKERMSYMKQRAMMI